MMDEFLRDIYTNVFRQWILSQDQKDYQIKINPKNDNQILILTEYSYSEITFNPLNIIEFNVVNTFNNEVEFYLHFQMKTLQHAIELFNEMMDSIKKLIYKPVAKILLCCSGGLTTAFFASKMNEAAKLLYFNYEASAIGYQELFNVGDNYDIILLAPQISYMHAKVQEILKNQLVIKIPPQVFAKYDVGKMIAIIKDAMEHYKQMPVQKSQHTLSLHTSIVCKAPILCLAIIRNSNRVHIAYRLYGRDNRIQLDKEIIKNNISFQDFYDVIDTVLAQYPDIQMIGISIPGIINNESITSAHVNGLEDINVQKMFTQKYKQKIIFSNDVNTAVVGYYASQNQYSSLSLLFQPNSFYAGAGTIIDGQLITGRSNIAGEVQYLPLNLSDNPLILNKTPEGAIELVSKIILCLMATIDPDAIVLFCTLIPEISELIKELEKSVPHHHIPDIIKIDNLNEYTLIGQMILCAQQL